MKMQDVGAAAALPAGPDNGCSELSSGASTLNEGHETQSFWDIDRTSSSWIHRVFDWLGASILSKQRQLSFRLLPAMGSQDNEGNEESKSSRDCEDEKGHQIRKPGRRVVDCRPLIQRLSDL